MLTKLKLKNKSNSKIYLNLFVLFLVVFSSYNLLLKQKPNKNNNNDFINNNFTYSDNVNSDIYNISNINNFNINFEIDLKPKNSNNFQEKWIVVTTINNEPTGQLKKLANIGNFQLLVIGDIKTSKKWRLKNAIYLNIEKQKSENSGLVWTI